MSGERWTSSPTAEEPWSVEIEMDVFSAEEGAVVSIFTKHAEEGDKTDETLITPSPAQAREMAEAIVRAADRADAHERRPDVIAERSKAERRLSPGHNEKGT